MKDEQNQEELSQEDIEELLDAYVELATEPRLGTFDFSNPEDEKLWRSKLAELTSGSVKPDHILECVHLFVPTRPVALYCYAFLWNDVKNTATYFLAADPSGTPFAAGVAHQYGQVAKEQFAQWLQSVVTKMRGKER